MGALHDAVQAAGSENERKAIKAQAWVDEGLAEGWNFNYRGHKVVLSVVMDASTGNVVFAASLEKAGQDVTPDWLNPITIVNPPYLVEDAAGDVSIVYLDVDGQEQTVTAREDVPDRILSQLQDLGDKVIDSLMSTTVVYASGDSGYIYSQDATYLTAARQYTAGGVIAASTVAGVGQDDGTFRVFQGFLKWDTSAIGADTVSDVDFEVDGSGDFTDVDFTIEGYEYDWGATLTSADFRDSDADIPALGSIISSYDTSGGWTLTAGYNQDMGALSAFDSAINGAGDTRIVILSSEHRLESEPTGGAEYVTLECTGATNDARLTITHASVHAVSPTDDITTTGWATAPLWSKIDDDPDSPDATVISATAS